ncbi:peptidoglycan/xylan/chitin deacetylase (PgdA/CDA1 family) [Yimella lutea]|uniref:Peptidoglycan/xylan/chitin deacetylase (PgdA/CDA1 family) n=1 Tax=Yimella lutea TaxID=587872 RepID=A0A542EE61_9MICO|nr:polysaccharide deacetylase family protein [Yimella lutea]TQJ13605.1 peptidoglycan/xylan/chitin deacetylase (PgdA/CDA1 family) [Yimella lutea]
MITRRRASTAAVAAVALSALACAPVAEANPSRAGTPAHRGTPTSTRPIVALTFDDGPSALTPQVLRVLAKHNVKATFFMQGSHVAANPALARRVAREGHTIGNHSYSHPNFTSLTPEQADTEITSTNAVIQSVTGVKPVLFRYPFGVETDSGNAVIRREQMWGGVMWHWATSDPGDFECPGRRGVVEYVVGNAVDQALILLHDGNDVLDCGARQVRFLDAAVTKLKARGFRFGVVVPADGPSTVNDQSWVQVVEPTRATRR